MAMPRTILIVDDNEADQHAYRRTLTDRDDYKLVSALSAQEGLAALAGAKPDLILLDYNLPDMDGLLFMSRLVDASPETIPVVMLTGEGDESLAVEAMKSGVEDYVVKQVDGRHLKLLPSVIGLAIRKHAMLKAKECTEMALRLSEKRYRTLFDNTLQGIAHCRLVYRDGQPADFIYLEVNPAFYRLTGLPDVTGRTVTEVIPGILESNPEMLEFYARVARHGEPEQFETFIRELGIWLSITVYQAEPRCFVAIFENITERKGVEQEMIVTNNRLATEVAMRTADLSALTAHIQKIAEIERANLARELHDELGSTLVGIGMAIGRLKEKIDAPDLLQDLAGIKGLVAHAMEIKQDVVNELYPTVLKNAGLVEAIAWQVRQFRKRSGITVELDAPEYIDADDAISLAAYRITQECLTNIAKHAAASRVNIEINASNDALNLTIRDNGKGLPRAFATGRHGIFGMIERARYLGGSMEIESENGSGTAARLRLPLTANGKGSGRDRREHSR